MVGFLDHNRLVVTNQYHTNIIHVQNHMGCVGLSQSDLHDMIIVVKRIYDNHIIAISLENLLIGIQAH